MVVAGLGRADVHEQPLPGVVASEPGNVGLVVRIVTSERIASGAEPPYVRTSTSL